MKASSCGHDQSRTVFPASLPSLENGGLGGGRGELKIPSLQSWLGLSSDQHSFRSLIRTKNAPITQEIPRDIETLCQEPGSRTQK